MSAGTSFGRDAAIYDRTRRQLIPCFDDFYAAAVAQIGAPVDAPLRILDLGAGTGILSSFLARRFPNATFVLVDAAAEMLERARERLVADAHRIEFAVADFGIDALPAGPFDAIVSALAIHHLEDDGKQALFVQVQGRIAPGGVFVNADQVAGRTDDVTRRNHESWLAAVRALGVGEPDLAAALDRMTHDRIAPVGPQLQWMEDAGLRDADCAYKDGMFAVMSARA